MIKIICILRAPFQTIGLRVNSNYCQLVILAYVVKWIAILLYMPASLHCFQYYVRNSSYGSADFMQGVDPGELPWKSSCRDLQEAFERVLLLRYSLILQSPFTTCDNAKRVRKRQHTYICIIWVLSQSIGVSYQYVRAFA